MRKQGLTITKISQYRKLKETTSGTLGKIVGGISYVAIIAIIIDFTYKSGVLVIVAALAYIYMIMDAYKILMKKQF